MESTRAVVDQTGVEETETAEGDAAATKAAKKALKDEASMGVEGREQVRTGVNSEREAMEVVDLDTPSSYQARSP